MVGKVTAIDVTTNLNKQTTERTSDKIDRVPFVKMSLKKHFNNPVMRQFYKDKVWYLFITPFMVLFLTFTVLPVAISIFYSFTYFNILEPPRFIGFENYIKLFMKDNVFLIAIKNTFILAAITGPVSYIMSLLVAWFINELTPKVRALITLIFYAPSISGNIYLIWAVMFSGDAYGYVNGMLLKMHLISSPIQFFTTPQYMMPLIIMIALWLSLGTSFLAFIAGLQGIDKQYYEAGAMDGVKNRWQELWYITLPLMKQQLMFGAVMNITASFGIGEVISGLVGFPSTGYAVHTIMHHLTDYGSIRFEMGYASAIATILFLIMLISNLYVKKIISNIGN
jgi:multiple sugar transport system permease protein